MWGTTMFAQKQEVQVRAPTKFMSKFCPIQRISERCVFPKDFSDVQDGGAYADDIRVSSFGDNVQQAAQRLTNALRISEFGVAKTE